MKKILTLIMDGYGYREETHGNAIWAAKPHNFSELLKTYPHAFIEASGEAVGLEKDQFGNSEIGHMTIGAGRRIKPPKELVDDYLKDPVNLKDIINEIRISNKRVHLMGLFSNGRVHSDMEHFHILYNLLCDNGIEEIYFHLITDGRDTKQTEFLDFYQELNNWIKEKKKGGIATVCGRYYAMDRDKNYDRTNIYYNLIAYGEGEITSDLPKTINKYYSNGITDEFMKPIVVDREGLIDNNDVIFWINYRTDRAKQIISSLTNRDFKEFKKSDFSNLDVYSFVEIDKKVPTNVLNTHNKVENPLGIYLSQLGLTQARVAETEKYAHVTYFFDGEYNGAVENCDKFLIPSPDVETYDLKPEMSIVKVTKKVMDCMENDYDFIFANFANPDMVGHTGNFDATVKAIMATDICLGKLLEVANDNFYTVIVMADHGNADTMLDENNNPVTTHSMAKVPFIICDDKIKLKEKGNLTNVAPTILEYMDITIPKEMDSQSLIKKSER